MPITAVIEANIALQQSKVKQHTVIHEEETKDTKPSSQDNGSTEGGKLLREFRLSDTHSVEEQKQDRNSFIEAPSKPMKEEKRPMKRSHSHPTTLVEERAEAEEETYELTFLKFHAEDYKGYNEQLFAGERLINIPATTAVLCLIVNVLQELKKDLMEIMAFGRMIPFRLVRKFAVGTLMLEQAELCLYNAFSSPTDDIFYLPDDHPDLELLRDNTFEHSIENYDKYKFQLRFTMNSIVAGGAAVFKALEQEGLLK